jgi:hypothetical protein
VVVQVDGDGKHYELTVGPVRKRFMIVPEAEYTVKAFTQEKSAGMNFLHVDKIQENGAKGLHVKIRFWLQPPIASVALRAALGRRYGLRGLATDAKRPRG